MNPTRLPEQGGIVARINGNSISEYTTKIGLQAGKLDLVVANPPYGTDDYGVVYANSARNNENDNRWKAGIPTRSEGEWAFLQTIVDLLSPQSIAVIVMPLGILFRDGGGDFRKWLIEKDWIEGVISTPSNPILTTSITVCLLVLNKNKKTAHKNGVFFVNASLDFTKVGKFHHWDFDKALATWNERREEIGYYGFVSTKRLRKAPKYSLAVNRWFSPVIEKEQYNPIELAQDIQKLKEIEKVRGAWLDDIFAQASALWAQNEAQASKENSEKKDE